MVAVRVLRRRARTVRPADGRERRRAEGRPVVPVGAQPDALRRAVVPATPRRSRSSRGWARRSPSASCSICATSSAARENSSAEARSPTCARRSSSLGLTPPEAERGPGGRRGRRHARSRTCSGRPCRRWGDDVRRRRRLIEPIAVDPRGARVRRRAAPEDPRRVRRAGAGEGTAGAADRRRARRAASRSTTCCSAGPPGLGKTTLAQIVAARDGRGVPAHVAARRSIGRATSPRSSRTSRTATCCSSTRSTGCRGRSRRSSIRRSRTSASTSCSARARRPGRSAWTCRGSRSSPPPPGRAHHAAAPRTVRVLARGSTTTRREDLTTIVLRSAGILAVAHRRGRRRPRSPGRSRGTPRIANRLLRRVRDVAEVRHDGAITRRHRAGGPRGLRGRRARASTGSITRSCGPSSSGSAGGRWA